MNYFNAIGLLWKDVSPYFKSEKSIVENFDQVHTIQVENCTEGCFVLYGNILKNGIYDDENDCLLISDIHLELKNIQGNWKSFEYVWLDRLNFKDNKQKVFYEVSGIDKSGSCKKIKFSFCRKRKDKNSYYPVSSDILLDTEIVN
jgi:hypothetical protein